MTAVELCEMAKASKDPEERRLLLAQALLEIDKTLRAMDEVKPVLVDFPEEGLERAQEQIRWWWWNTRGIKIGEE